MSNFVCCSCGAWHSVPFNATHDYVIGCSCKKSFTYKEYLGRTEIAASKMDGLSTLLEEIVKDPSIQYRRIPDFIGYGDRC